VGRRNDRWIAQPPQRIEKQWHHEMPISDSHDETPRSNFDDEALTFTDDDHDDLNRCITRVELEDGGYLAAAKCTGHPRARISVRVESGIPKVICSEHPRQPICDIHRWFRKQPKALDLFLRLRKERELKRTEATVKALHKQNPHIMGAQPEPEAKPHADAKPGASLNLAHLKNLRASGISDEVIAQRGCRTINSFAELPAVFAQTKIGREQFPGLLLTLHSVKGETAGFQYRPDTPLTFKDKETGKDVTLKYINPKGSKVPVDVPPACLPRLNDPSADIWFSEGVKKADAGASAGLCIVNIGGCGNWSVPHTKEEKKNKVPRLLKPELKAIPWAGRCVYLAMDHDTHKPSALENVAYQTKLLAEKLYQEGCADVWILRIPPRPNGKGALDDALADGLTINDLIATKVHADRPNQLALSGARELAVGQAKREAPRPLQRKLPPPEEYPVDALGELMASAARAIQCRVRCPAAITAQSVLATACLAVQAFADVRLPIGQTRPLSLYLATIAKTGERKTSADDLATEGKARKETRLKLANATTKVSDEAELASYKAEHARIMSNRKLSRDERRAALEELGPEPEGPLIPLLTCEEPTIEGLYKLFTGGYPSLGIFSSEGGQFIGGYSMSTDHRVRTASSLSRIWDCGEFPRVRGGDGASKLYGRRLALHLLMQPMVADILFSDDLLAGQGILSRILVCAPETLIGTRDQGREFTAEDAMALHRFTDRISDLLDYPLPLIHGTRNELAPRVLTMGDAVAGAWQDFADRIEREQAAGGKCETITGFASKAAEQAARIAGIIELTANPMALNVDFAALDGGIALIEFYLSEQLRIRDAAQASGDLALAEKFLHWLQTAWKEPDGRVGLTDAYQFGPRPIREKATASRVIRLLEDHGWLIRVPEGCEVNGTYRREVWQITDRSSE
jgi:hypothetical protein